MNARRRSGKMNRVVGSAPKNAATSRKDSETQAKMIKGNVSCPSAAGFKKLKGAV